MSTWVIISWVCVAILTAINIIIFVKLKSASEQMLKMAFPNAKNMNEALAQMQNMMGAMGARGGMPKGAGKGKGGRDAQLRAAMEMLQKSKGKGGRR